ncbi:MAG: NmrA/HSCARG family protein [bacterium]|nr:NmrA/HSCARG family protein [Candidatus Kapabacteria bacterium]
MQGTAKLTVLVVGATGQQGAPIARLLLERGHNVRAMTRKPDGEAAQALSKLGATIVAGDLEDRSSLDAALKGVDTVYAIVTPYEAGEDAETRQGQNLVEAAHAAGVAHFVYSSVASADRKTGIPHFDSKWRIEEKIHELGVPHTIIRPVFFMENLNSPMFGSGIASGVFGMAMPGDRSLQHISLHDLTHFGALVVESRERFLGADIDIASDEVTGDHVASVIANKLGKPLGYTATPIEQVRSYSKDMATMFEWFDTVGYDSDVAGLRKEYPEVGWQTFDQWANTVDWKAVS